MLRATETAHLIHLTRRPPTTVEFFRRISTTFTAVPCRLLPFFAFSDFAFSGIKKLKVLKYMIELIVPINLKTYQCSGFKLAPHAKIFPFRQLIDSGTIMPQRLQFYWYVVISSFLFLLLSKIWREFSEKNVFLLLDFFQKTLHI